MQRSASASAEDVSKAPLVSSRRAQDLSREGIEFSAPDLDGNASAKRSLPSHLLSKFSLFRSTSAQQPRASATSISSSSPPTHFPENKARYDATHAPDLKPQPRRGVGHAEPSSTSPRSKARLRSRTGSLRKVALLGGSGRSRFDQRTAGRSETAVLAAEGPQSCAGRPRADGGPSQPLGSEVKLAQDDRDHWTPCARPQGGQEEPRLHGNDGVKKRNGGSRTDHSASETSTTDEEEPSGPPAPSLDDLRKRQPSYVPASYFPPVSQPSPHQPPSLPPPRRHHSSKRARSPLAEASHSAASLSATSTSASNAPITMGALASDVAEVDDDDAETARWGWLLLAATWLLFVVGVGSCFGVWSWAWDVGRTPYAPPELEDDPTLPIVGYYPALIVLTGVVAWVWVGVAWMGMKYFRHAKISGEG